MHGYRWVGGEMDGRGVDRYMFGYRGVDGQMNV